MNYEVERYQFDNLVTAEEWLSIKMSHGFKLEALPLFKSLNNTWIDLRAEIGKGTIVYPGCFIIGPALIGENCIFYPNVIMISNLDLSQQGFPAFCMIGDGCRVWANTYINILVAKGVTLGLPSVKNSYIDEDSVLGAVSEINRCKIGRRVKMVHHGYLGDTEIGDDSNVGAGAITANFDGVNKNKTILGKGAFIGVNVNIIAPNEFPEETLIAAGSTIPQNLKSLRKIPPQSMIISRMKKFSIKARKMLRI